MKSVKNKQLRIKHTRSPITKNNRWYLIWHGDPNKSNKTKNLRSGKEKKNLSLFSVKRIVYRKLQRIYELLD